MNSKKFMWPDFPDPDRISVISLTSEGKRDSSSIPSTVGLDGASNWANKLPSEKLEAYHETEGMI